MLHRRASAERANNRSAICSTHISQLKRARQLPEFLPNYHTSKIWASMNLMDMLSAGAENSAIPTEFPAAYDQQAPESLPSLNNVYYFPTTFTKLQNDMSEAVVQIFGPSMLQQIVAKGQRASINSLLEVQEPVFNGQPPTMDDGELSALLFDQLQRVSRHPSLVVDHFIPKKLLLLEVKDRLLHMSGKLEFFNRVVDLISKKYEYPAGITHDYNLLVVAETVKELEWIEGLIIGKKLRYLNLSARKLYDEEEKLARFVKEESVDDDQQSHEFKKRRRHFVARRAKQSKHTPVFTLHLVTSRQLYLSYSSSTPFDMIVSFDGELDTESASIELLRSNNKVNNRSLRGVLVKTPIIVPISLFSIEHVIHLIPRPAVLFGLSDSEKAWKLRVVHAFIANRHRLFESSDKNFYLEAYGRDCSRLLDWLFSWDKVLLSPKVKQLLAYLGEVVLSCSDEKLEKRLNDNFLHELGKIFTGTANGWEKHLLETLTDDTPLNYETFKKKFAEVLNHRITQAETLRKEGNASILPEFRENEARRQEELDHDEELIGGEYRKLRKLNEDANVVDRKFNRSETEHARVLALATELSEMITHLEDVVKNKNEDELKSLLEEQKLLLSQLEEEKEKLDGEYTKLVDDTEQLRTEYQNKSAAAVHATHKLNSAKELQTQLESKLARPGMTTLPTLARNDEKLVYDSEISRLVQENDFIKLLFSKRLDQLVKERSAILDSTSSGSSSRPTNRLSRASTPFT